MQYEVLYVMSGAMPPIQSITVEAPDISQAAWNSGVLISDIICVKLVPELTMVKLL